MISRAQIATFVGGLGLLLFGLHLFEDAIKSLTTKTFKGILRRFTSTKIKAIFTGIFATSVLQSSTVVSFIVIAFVGAGVLTFSNAVGVIIGTNVGGVLPDIILGTIGLKFSITTLAFFVIGVGGPLLLIFKRGTFHTLANVFLGLGILFLGLGFMKDSMLIFAQSIDFSTYQHLSPLVFFFVGRILTMLLYSSSAMVILTLTAAHSGLIALDAGMGLIMGAFLGTSVTVSLWSLGGNQYKKQAALSHVLFNAISILLGFVVFPLMVMALRNLGFEKDLVSGLSVFAVGFKLCAAILFFPFVGYFVRLIQYLVPEKKYEFNLHTEKIGTGVPELCLDAMRYDAIKLMKKIFKYNLNVFDIDESSLLNKNFEFDKVVSVQKDFEENNLDQQYVTIKAIEEKLITFGLHIKSRTLSFQEIQDIDALYKTISSEASSAKYIKDIRLNVQDLQESENSFMIDRYVDFRKVLVNLYKHISVVIDGQTDVGIFTEIVQIVKEIKDIDKQFLSSLSKGILSEHMDSLELAGLINVNRYVYLSSLSLVFALRDLFLTSKENAIFEELEGF